MKFVALVSGGKDSCYNVHKCLQYGHELACLANLHPPTDEAEDEEMNSHMYQSAAHGAIPAQAECFGVPLVRRRIQGSALCQTLHYDSNPNPYPNPNPNPAPGCDEVEDLFLLLQEVQERYPEVTAVSCGAILSNYQVRGYGGLGTGVGGGDRRYG